MTFHVLDIVPSTSLALSRFRKAQPPCKFPGASGNAAGALCAQTGALRTRRAVGFPGLWGELWVQVSQLGRGRQELGMDRGPVHLPPHGPGLRGSGHSVSLPPAFTSRVWKTLSREKRTLARLLWE